jgi:hypothetical protein
MKRANMIVGFAVLAFAGAAIAAGCNGNSGSCSATVPSSCPTSAPSYANDVAPILSTYCTSCHASGGQESDKPLDTYAHVAALSAEVQGQVAGCSMPPSGSMSAADITTVLTWIECGAQDN